MPIHIKHECDDCTKEADHSLCDECLNIKMQGSYDEGHSDGYDMGHEAGSNDAN